MNGLLGRLSLRGKLVLLISVLLGMISLFLMVVFPARFEVTSQQWAKRRTQDVATVLAASIAVGVEFDDAASVNETLSGLKSARGAVYAGVREPGGRLFAAWNPNEVPQFKQQAREAEVELGARLVEARVPVMTKSGPAGTLVVAYSLEELEQEKRANLWSVALASAVVMGFGLLAAFLIGSLIVRPIVELTRVTRKIVEEGDLTQKVVVRSRDEIGALASSFSQMVDKLKEIPISLHASVQILGDSVRNLDVSTQEQTQTVTKQAAALQETQVTAQEIKQTSLLAAQKAELVLKVAERAESVGRSGEAAIEQSLGALTDIRGQVDEIARKISALGDRTKQIGVITQTVKDLADQSNMLALNAAIEAVRSGEHGKGFTVVAREIRSLADQSIQATNRVREILEDITAAIQVAVTSTDKGAQKMEAGLVQVKASGENLRELSNIVKDNSSAVRQIAAAVSQQNAGITQIFTAVTELSTMMDDTVKRLDTTTLAASTLKDATEKVSNVVRNYRVS